MKIAKALKFSIVSFFIMLVMVGNLFAHTTDVCNSYDSCFASKEYARAQCYKISSIHNLLDLVVKKLGPIDGGIPTLVTPGYSGPSGPAGPASSK